MTDTFTEILKQAQLVIKEDITDFTKKKGYFNAKKINCNKKFT